MVTDLPLDLGYAVYTPVLDTHITPAQQVSSADNLNTFYFSSKIIRDRSYSVTQRHRCRSRYLSMSCKSMGPLPQHYTARRTLNGFASVSSVYVSMRSGGSDACAPRKFFLTVPRELCCNLFNSQALLEFHYLLSTSKTRCYA